MRQTTSTLLMIRPRHFYFNPETAQSNFFQKELKDLSRKEILEKVQEEFDTMVNVIRSKGIKVLMVEDTDTPKKPDAIFPNNWVIFHQTGRVALFPMEAKSRRAERRDDILEKLKKDYKIREILDYSENEEQGKYLEGTGSLVFDHENHLAYACLSRRTDEALVQKFCEDFDYQPVTFRAHDRNGGEIYHTNVMMCVGTEIAIVCLDSISDEKDRQIVVDSLVKNGKELIPITMEQMHQFAGNMLELQDKNGKPYLLMSAQAYESLTRDQVKKIRKYTEIISSPIDTIEQLGGGSARCMVAEVFLQEKE